MKFKHLSTLSLVTILAACGGSQLVEFPDQCDCPAATGHDGGTTGTGGDTGTGGADTGTGGTDSGSGGHVDAGGTGGTDSGTGGHDGGVGGDSGSGGTDSGTGGSVDSGGGGGSDSGTGGSTDSGGGGSGDSGSGGSDAGTGGGDGGGPPMCGGKPVSCDEWKNHGQCVSHCAHECKYLGGKDHKDSCHVRQDCFKECKAVCDCLKDHCKKTCSEGEDDDDRD